MRKKVLYFRLLVFKTKSNPGWLARSSRAFCFWQFVSSRLYNWRLCGSFGSGLMIFHSMFLLESFIEKNLNSDLPFGQAALRFCLLWVSLSFLIFSWQMACLGTCPLHLRDNWSLWVTEIYGHCRLPLRIKFEPCAIAGSWSKEVI